MKKNLFFTLSLFLGIVLYPQFISAQSAPQLDLSVDPATDFIQVLPNQKAVHTITLTHNGTTPLQVTPHLVDFTPDGKTGQPQLSDQASVNFVSIQNPDLMLDQPFTLTPHITKKIDLLISPTADTITREYPLTLLFQTQADPDTTLKGTTSQTNAVIGSNMIIFVGDESLATGEMSVSQLNLPYVIDSFQPLRFSAQIFNDNAKAAPIQGKITVSDWMNRELMNYTLAPDVVLGKSHRLVRPETENEQNSSTKFIFDKPFLMGFYTVEVTLDQPQAGVEAFVSMKRRVIALPFSMATVIITSAIAYFFLRRKINRTEF